jgi:two-component system sensor histidine kinase YesM
MGRQSQIHRMLQRLSEVVKYALSDPMEEVTIRTEIDYLKAYLDIQNVRFDNNGITYFEVDESVWEMHVFRLLLQPILENCFEHGMHTDGSRIVIKVKIFNRGDHLAFSVTDNGQGMTKEEREQLMERIRSADAKSIGLVNLNRRLILHYGEESTLHILSRKNAGTVISFRIPIAAMTAPMTEKEENKLE